MLGQILNIKFEASLIRKASKIHTAFYQCCLRLDWLYRKPPKLDYCFIMNTSLVSVAVSTWI